MEQALLACLHIKGGSRSEAGDSVTSREDALLDPGLAGRPILSNLTRKLCLLASAKKIARFAGWFFGGSGEIRTHGGLSTSPVFKTGAFNRSATLPVRGRIMPQYRRLIQTPATRLRRTGSLVATKGRFEFLRPTGGVRVVRFLANRW